MAGAVIHFGGPRDSSIVAEGAQVVRRRRIVSVREAAAAGLVGALLLDARGAADQLGATRLLRALFDDPRRPQRLLHPGRVLALIATGDVEAAFALGRYGLAGVVEERAIETIGGRLVRMVDSTPEAPPLPLAAPLREALLGPREEGELPTVALAFRHAPATLDALAHYGRVLRQGGGCTVFEDVATLLEVLVGEGLTCQTNLACKAGATHDGQFIGSFAFYRELRRTRYAAIPDHPSGAIDMDVFIAVDEVLHEVLHLLFLANELRAGVSPRHVHIAEELSLTWWQAVVHNRVFPGWLGDRRMLELNDDFMLCAANQEPFHFWEPGNVFDAYAAYPWVPYVLARLPERVSYIGQRPDLEVLTASLAQRPEAGFLLRHGPESLAVPGRFDAYPVLPATLALDA